MKRFNLLLSSLLFFLSSLTSVSAERYETHKLFSHKSWTVELTHDQLDDEFWCAAQTTNKRGQLFSLTAFDSGNLALFVFDSRWKMRPRDIQYRIDIDYSRWEITGQAKDQAVSTLLNDPEKSIKFLTEISEGRAVAMYNVDGRKLAVFSLQGSSAALRKLIECANRISNSDPFQSSTDPF